MIMKRKEEDIRYSYAEKDRLMRMTEIGLWIDSYQDLFSDFDPRPYKDKALSSDFLDEAKRASRDKDHQEIKMVFLIKKENRNIKDENIIIKRLKDHFRKHFARLNKERYEIIKQGLLFTVVGIILMLAASYILFKFQNKTFWTYFFIVMLEPAGWFLFWEGLHQIVFESKIKDPDYIFYEKMSRCNVSFMNY